MQFKNLLALLPFLVSATTAFVVPEGIEDGSYAVNFATDGSLELTKFETLADGSIKERAVPIEGNSAKYGKQLAARNSQGNTGRTFDNHGDYNYCVDGMKDAFRSGLSVGAKKLFFVTRGSSFLALCNYANSAQGGLAYEVDNFNGALDNAFGAWTTGWYHFSGPNKTLWRDRTGNAVCENI
ncbi:hypothetical protein QBC44DRAFT_336771 [Cladorrhinum sp. PSN332]|nr:hypothetical protein QBC44DRAFT_336771 [Cladorrhinum sp. PSN332]